MYQEDRGGRGTKMVRSGYGKLAFEVGDGRRQKDAMKDRDPSRS